MASSDAKNDDCLILSPEEQAEIEEAVAEADANLEGRVEWHAFLRQLREES